MYPIDQQAVNAMSDIIRHFLERQKFVALAMLDIHPGPLRMAGIHILGFEIAPYASLWEERIYNDDDFARNWQSGIWRGEWKHWAHGAGCRLTNIHTGEPIEWGAPDLQAFDERWFWLHLEWRIQRATPVDKVKAYTQWLWSIYQHVLEQELIVLTEDGKYKLQQ
jgi:hypothetical protein